MRPSTEDVTIDGAKQAGAAPRIEKMAYRAAGTTSVSAKWNPEKRDEFGPVEAKVQSGHNDYSTPTESATELSNRIIELEGQLANAERTASGEMEQRRRDSEEYLRRALDQAEQGYKVAIEAATKHFGAALQSFETEKGDYFERVEQEVVRLALAIAARILNREANLDPMLLAGAVRVALKQLGETSGIRLRCPVEQVSSWAELLRSPRGNSFYPEIVGDSSLAVGDCVLEAMMGNVDLGVRSQLQEIERGFFDLLELRRGTGEGVRDNVAVDINLDRAIVSNAKVEGRNS